MNINSKLWNTIKLDVIRFNNMDKVIDVNTMEMSNRDVFKLLKKYVKRDFHYFRTLLYYRMGGGKIVLLGEDNTTLFIYVLSSSAGFLSLG